MADKEKQIEQIANDINMHCCSLAEQFCGETSCNACLTNFLYNAGYRKQSEVIDEFAEKLKEAPIKCGLPLFGLSTKEEIEEYFNGIMLQVRDAIDNIATEMKGGEE
jgi:hypothetical protein